MIATKRARVGAALAAAGFGFLILSGFTGGAAAQGKPEDQGPNVRSTKQPGQTCNQFEYGSDAYKACVEAAAKSYKPEGGEMGTGMGKGQGMEHGKGMGDDMGQGMGPGEGMGPEGMEHGKSMDKGKGMGDGMGPGEGMDDGMEHGKGMDKGKGKNR